MLFLRSAIFNLWVYGSIPFYGLIHLPWALVSREGAYAALRNYSRHTLWMMKTICNLDYEVRGTPPEGEVVLAAKHQSYIDMVIIMAHVPRPRYIIKKELKWAPFLGYYAVRIGCILVDRGKKGAAVKSMTEGIKAQRGDGAQVTIFPQGTRVAPAVDMPYKVGVWRIYDAFGVPCIPAATNAGLFWGRKTFLRHPGNILFEFLDPIPVGRAADPFMAELEDKIETVCRAQNLEAGFPNGRLSAPSE
jgi:1-acyl-sn-glycerol-3-phosphate acyltransferase